jgi:hypothetical protein
MSISRIYNHNWSNISTTYTYNKISIKWNILTTKKKKYIGKEVRLRTYQHPGTGLPNNTTLSCTESIFEEFLEIYLLEAEKNTAQTSKKVHFVTYMYLQTS